MYRLLPLIALLACGSEPPATDRTPCEETCWQRELITCRDLCNSDCGADDVCRDTCHGDCLDRYQACADEECS